ncbi:FolB domain-containing protein [Phlyctema vagabunda]|uniref:FolB domain-containing protein n=1 Tax=Phlyctema vagabunda TaxID=108571 RepID=A0ABR4PNE4_9HELO
MARLQTAWEVNHAAGEPQASISVKNLQATAKVATDAWGRTEKLQPVLLSARVSLRHAFASASETDTVTNSTIHYGILSKAILEAVSDFNQNKGHAVVTKTRTETETGRSKQLRDLLDHVAEWLTHARLDASISGGVVSSKQLMNAAMVKVLEIKVLLPKASLIGNGVSLTGAAAYDEVSNAATSYSMSLRLHDLRIPTLIGVNDNERLAKQIVIANIEIDRWPRFDVDCYVVLEELTIEESSFQTLEALAVHIGQRVIKYFLFPRQQLDNSLQNIKICLEKPTAVTWADAPAVEMLLSSDLESEMTSRLGEEWKEGGSKAVPFPLHGRLDQWIQENYPTDST